MGEQTKQQPRIPQVDLEQRRQRNQYLPVLIVGLSLITSLAVLLVYVLVADPVSRQFVLLPPPTPTDAPLQPIVASSTDSSTPPAVQSTSMLPPTMTATQHTTTHAQADVVPQPEEALVNLVLRLQTNFAALEAMSTTIEPLPAETTNQPSISATAVTKATEAPVTPTFQYMFPVQPPDVASFGPKHHDYPATDIFAPVGSVVVAVTDGTIDELSREDHWDPASDDPALRGGLFVSLIGSDGVRYYYSHLSSVEAKLEPGDHVAAGQVVGFVGKTGNARSTPSHVHFGISHPTEPGDWATRRGEVSPYPYLRAWLKHQNTTPALNR